MTTYFIVCTTRQNPQFALISTALVAADSPQEAVTMTIAMLGGDIAKVEVHRAPRDYYIGHMPLLAQEPTPGF